jgi:hypothetical protein
MKVLRWEKTSSAPYTRSLADVRGVVAALLQGRRFSLRQLQEWTHEHVHAAVSEGLAPWLYAQLKRREETAPGKSALSALQESYRKSALGALVYEATLRRLLPFLNSRGLPVILLKGAYLGYFVYGDPALRPMCDIDLMVRPEDLPVVRQAMEDLEYRILVEPLPERFQVLKPAITYVASGSFSEVVDLHYGLKLMDYYRMDSRILWYGAFEAEIHEAKVLLLSPEANFIHIALHALNHRGPGRAWLDLALLSKEIGWGRLVSLGEALGVVRPLELAIRELVGNWGVDAPGEALKSLGLRRPSWMEDRVIRGPGVNFWRFIARLGLLARWRDRMAYLHVTLLHRAKDRLAATGLRGLIAYAKSKLSLAAETDRRI